MILRDDNAGIYEEDPEAWKEALKKLASEGYQLIERESPTSLSR